MLGLLMEGPSHGYGLHQRLLADLGNVWRLSQSQSYSVLKRLEERGEITSRRRKQQKLPARQVLHITAAGRKRFLQWLQAEPASSARAVRLEFLSRLYFAKLLWPKRVGQIYAAQAREVSRAIRHLRHQITQTPSDQAFNRLSLDLRLRQMELVRAWLREVRDKYQIKAADAT